MTLLQRVYTTIYRRVWILSKDLLRDERAAPDFKHLRIGFLEAAMLDAYEAFRPGKREEARQRMDQGHRSVVVCEGDRIVGCVWAATGRAYIPYLDRDIVLGPAEIYTFDAFTHPDARRKGIATFRNSFLTPEYRRMGYERAAGIVAFENYGGIRSAEAAGYERQGVFACVRLGFTQFDLPGPAAPAGRFAKPSRG